LGIPGLDGRRDWEVKVGIGFRFSTFYKFIPNWREAWETGLLNRELGGWLIIEVPGYP